MSCEDGHFSVPIFGVPSASNSILLNAAKLYEYFERPGLTIGISKLILRIDNIPLRLTRNTAFGGFSVPKESKKVVFLYELGKFDCVLNSHYRRVSVLLLLYETTIFA